MHLYILLIHSCLDCDPWTFLGPARVQSSILRIINIKKNVLNLFLTDWSLKLVLQDGQLQAIEFRLVKCLLS